ncbi:unnamed protein product [Paramecium pentaurelia]|uniref:Palmitoyltransferase n=1 Tax=Paramecium pentaurelia TaxID=43138 RepID=A0A8S1TEE2_9CILI|nr:unnamed protein product [Paramecium pentaurelia]
MDRDNPEHVPININQTENKKHQCCHHNHQHNHQNNHQHHHHHHQHSYNPFANAPKEMRVFIWYAILNGDYIMQIFMQLPMMAQGYYFYMMIYQTIMTPIYKLNGHLNQIMPDNILRQIFGGLAIYYFIAHGFLLYLNYETYPELNFILYIIYALFTTYFLVLLCPAGQFKQADFKELLDTKPELFTLSKMNRNICVLCSIPKVVRSQHCLYCQKCIKKWEFHSLQLNTCIGLYNYPFLILYLFSWTLYCFFILRQFTLVQRTQEKSFLDLLIILINIWQLYYFGQQYLLCLLRISYNITPSELGQWRKYSYLWANERGMFGNPFDKGIINNWISFFKPLFTSKGEENWATNKYINITDIPNHPLGAKAQQIIDQQIRHLRMMEKDLIKRQAVNEESEGLLNE